MWMPILFNFVSTLFTLVGLFGIYYDRPSHLIFFSIWQVVSLAWNSFLMALYMELGPLSLVHDLGKSSVSWNATDNCHSQCTQWYLFVYFRLHQPRDRIHLMVGRQRSALWTSIQSVTSASHRALILWSCSNLSWRMHDPLLCNWNYASCCTFHSYRSSAYSFTHYFGFILL